MVLQVEVIDRYQGEFEPALNPNTKTLKCCLSRDSSAPVQAEASKSLEDHRGEDGIAALDEPAQLSAAAANPESVTAQAR